jgi:hypothetical protein
MGMNIDAMRSAGCSLRLGLHATTGRTSANDNEPDDLLAQLMRMTTSV